MPSSAPPLGSSPATTYDPRRGARFLTRDPLVATTRDPYGYAANNPVNNTDPLGLFCVGSLCTPSAGDVKDAVGGMVDTVADTTRDVADLAYRNRHNIGTAVGVAACLSTSGVACAGGPAIGVLARSSKRIEEAGWDASFKENVFDATITAATFGLVRVPGKFALGRDGMRDISIFNRASSFPLWQRLEIVALRGTVGASQFVGRFGC